jgi:hypothetical protein
MLKLAASAAALLLRQHPHVARLPCHLVSILIT